MRLLWRVKSLDGRDDSVWIGCHNIARSRRALAATAGQSSDVANARDWFLLYSDNYETVSTNTVNPEWEQFGESCAGSRWFNGKPEVSERLVQTYEQRWLCPVKPCDGEMQFSGMVWPTGDPGYHHTCSKCGFKAAVCGGMYPRTVTKVIT